MEIIKHERERNNRTEEESHFTKGLIFLNWCDGKFFIDEEETTRYMENVKVLYQDRYNQAHDIIADLVFKQMGLTSAYTSSSALAGFHSMENDLTLIFRDGKAVLIYDEEKTKEFVYSVFEAFLNGTRI